MTTSHENVEAVIAMNRDLATRSLRLEQLVGRLEEELVVARARLRRAETNVRLLRQELESNEDNICNCAR